MGGCLYYGGQIVTMSGFGICEAMFVEKGMVIAVGRLEEMLRYEIHSAVNLEGMTVLPGFILAYSRPKQQCYEAGITMEQYEMRSRVTTEIQMEDMWPVRGYNGILRYPMAMIYQQGDQWLKNKPQSLLCPLRLTRTMRIPYTFLAPREIQNPIFFLLWCSVCRLTRNGVVLDSNQCISLYEALLAVTIYGAFEGPGTWDAGRLIPGKRADFVVVSQDPFQVEPRKLREVFVIATYSAGELVFRRET